MPGKCFFFFNLFSIVNLYSYNNNKKLMITGITIPLNISKLWHMDGKIYISGFQFLEDILKAKSYIHSVRFYCGNGFGQLIAEYTDFITKVVLGIRFVMV